MSAYGERPRASSRVARLAPNLYTEFIGARTLFPIFASWKERPELAQTFSEAYRDTSQAAEELSSEEGTRLLEIVLEARILFEELKKSYDQNEFAGALLRGYGQEAVGAGVGFATEARDAIARDHRSVSAALARGTTSLDFFLNHLMRETSLGRGRDPNVHFADLERNDLGFLASDMALGAVLINGAVWYLNAKRGQERGQGFWPKDLPADERSCGVAIFGDGASTNGIAHAGMNFAKARELPVLFVVLNNQIALRTTPQEEHGGVNLANRASAYEMPALTVDGDNAFEVYLASRLLLDFCRRTSQPALLHAVTFRRTGHNETEDTKYVERMYSKEFLDEWRSPERDPVTKARKLAEEFGWVDEKSFKALRTAIRERVQDARRQALSAPRPKVEERSALIDPACMAVSELVSASSEHSGKTTEASFRDAIRKALREELVRDPILAMLGEDIGPHAGGVFAVTSGLAEELPERVFNSTLDEGAIGGFVVGAGLLGGRVICEYQFWNFFLAGASVILTLAATRPYMMGVSVPGVLRGPVGYAPQSNHYHENWVETYLLKSLGIKVVVPATVEDAYGLTKSAVRDPDLVAVLEEMSFYGTLGELPEGEYFTPFSAAVRREGRDATLVTWGPKMLSLALTCAEELHHEGVETEVIDLRVLNPWDRDAVAASVRKTGRLVILHEDSSFMGFGAEVAASIAGDLAFYELRARIRRVAAENTPIPADLALEDARLPGKDDVLSAIRDLMKES